MELNYFDINNAISYYQLNCGTIMNKLRSNIPPKYSEIKEKVEDFYENIDQCENNKDKGKVILEILSESKQPEPIKLWIASIFLFYCLKNENPDFKSTNISKIESLSKKNDYKSDDIKSNNFNIENENISNVLLSMFLDIFNLTNESSENPADLKIIKEMLKKRGLKDDLDLEDEHIGTCFLNLASDENSLFTLVSIRLACPSYYKFLILIHFYNDILERKSKISINNETIDKLKELENEFLELKRNI